MPGRVLILMVRASPSRGVEHGVCVHVYGCVVVCVRSSLCMRVSRNGGLFLCPLNTSVSCLSKHTSVLFTRQALLMLHVRTSVFVAPAQLLYWLVDGVSLR